jgi:hypothetical protein
MAEILAAFANKARLVHEREASVRRVCFSPADGRTGD